jgi:hypothetical protein
MGPVLAFFVKIYQTKNYSKELKTFTILLIKEVDQRATVNLVELHQFCQGRSKFNLKQGESCFNGELASYFSTFSQNLLSEENEMWF